MNKISPDDSAHDKNNFGLLRLLAAYFVLISHSFGVLQKPLEQPGLWYNGKNIIFSGVGLSIFFTISGFLVTQSLFNSDSLKHYLWKRALRIFPALVVANLFCILLGCAITSLDLKDYLFNKATWAYLLKNSTIVVNQFYLPGVFNNLKENTVNASIWTILIEFECYVVLCLGARYIVSRKWLYLSCFVLFEALSVYATVIHHYHVRGLDLYAIFTFGTYFYIGSLLFVFKDGVRFKWFYANILMAIALATVYTFWSRLPFLFFSLIALLSSVHLKPL